MKKEFSLRGFINHSTRQFTKKETKAFLKLLAESLQNGFTLENSLHFLMTVTPKRQKEIKEMKRQLLRGKTLADSLSYLRLSSAQKAQLSFAEVHGDIVGTLNRMAQQMSDKERQQQHLAKVISYPILLLMFLSGVVMGMKFYVLPQLTELYEDSSNTNIGLQIVNHSPLIIAVSLLLILVTYLVASLFLKRKSAIYQANWLSQLPIFNKFLKSYYTSLFATEWGKLLTQGMEFRDVVLIMNQKGYTPLMREMAVTIEERIEKGVSIEGPIKEWQFLKPELNLIILQGEVKGNLGKELLIYGNKEWLSLIDLAEKKMRFLQPLMFLLIAILIISVYGALLLPIYSGMGEMY